MRKISTILLTKDCEHWYKDSSENVITLEFSKENIRIDLNDDQDLVISIVNPNCEIYDVLSKLAKMDAPDIKPVCENCENCENCEKHAVIGINCIKLNSEY